jgi:hypothetical protein
MLFLLLRLKHTIGRHALGGRQLVHLLVLLRRQRYRVRPHLVRMAAPRAAARTLRRALNVSACSVEELPGDETSTQAGRVCVIDLREQIREAHRTYWSHRSAYPSLIRRGSLDEATAQRQLTVQRAIVRTLQHFHIALRFLQDRMFHMHDPSTSSTDQGETPEAIRAELHALINAMSETQLMALRNFLRAANPHGGV